MSLEYLRASQRWIRGGDWEGKSPGKIAGKETRNKKQNKTFYFAQTFVLSLSFSRVAGTFATVIFKLMSKKGAILQGLNKMSSINHAHFWYSIQIQRQRQIIVLVEKIQIQIMMSTPLIKSSISPLQTYSIWPQYWWSYFHPFIFLFAKGYFKFNPFVKKVVLFRIWWAHVS